MIFTNPLSSPSIMASGGEASHRPVEVVVLERMFSYLVGSIDAISVLPEAFSEGLITTRQRTECSAVIVDSYKCAERFLEHLQRAVNGDCEKFHTFLQVLDRTGQEKIAEHLRGSSHIIIMNFRRKFYSLYIFFTESIQARNPDQHNDGNLLFIHVIMMQVHEY